MWPVYPPVTPTPAAARLEEFYKEAPFSVLGYKLFSRSHLELCLVKLELVRDKAELSVRGALGPSYLCPSQGAIGLRVFKELEAWCALCRMA